MYKVFDEACKDINITTGVIQISDNVRKVYFYLQFQDFPNDRFVNVVYLFFDFSLDPSVCVFFLFFFSMYSFVFVIDMLSARFNQNGMN